VTTATRWLVLLICVGVFGLAGTTLGRKHTVPERLKFSLFPNEIAGWTGKRVPIENRALKQLRLTDYLSRRYRRGEEQIELYVGFHGRQQRGTVIHSPAHCLPANGWYIVDQSRIPLPGNEDGPLINRMEVAFGEERSVVYYWYQGRGRILADELVSALYRAVDVALFNRSDEALVRFHSDATPEAEESMRRFIAEVAPGLGAYLPD
jgi:EpsI family protein